MITSGEKNTVIKCDKCGIMEMASNHNYNEVFFEQGWSLNLNAKKYVHRCRSCQTKKEKKAHDFVDVNFVNHCKSCGRVIDKGVEYCGECTCEDDIE